MGKLNGVLNLVAMSVIASLTAAPLCGSSNDPAGGGPAGGGSGDCTANITITPDALALAAGAVAETFTSCVSSVTTVSFNPPISRATAQMTFGDGCGLPVGPYCQEHPFYAHVAVLWPSNTPAPGTWTEKSPEGIGYLHTMTFYAALHQQGSMGESTSWLCATSKDPVMAGTFKLDISEVALGHDGGGGQIHGSVHAKCVSGGKEVCDTSVSPAVNAAGGACHDGGVANYGTVTIDGTF
jgi:hypothetical protein